MTFAPPTILEVRHFLKGEDPDLTDAELGIVGSAAHVRQGTSYHLGRDQLIMSKNPYSARTARDKAGLSNAASALDIGDDLDELRELSLWLVGQCMQLAPDTLDIREIIYSPDGVGVYQWDAERGTIVPHSDLSHRYHTHISWYRDSEFRDKTSVFKRFFGVEMDDWGPYGKPEHIGDRTTAVMIADLWGQNLLGVSPYDGKSPSRNTLQLNDIQTEVQEIHDQGVTVDMAALEEVIRRVVREEIDATKLGPAS